MCAMLEWFSEASAGFAGEPRQAVRITGEGVGQDLQRDITIEFRVAGPKHLPHRAFPD